jgi:Spy/CpxP family protein refolding chaperone
MKTRLIILTSVAALCVGGLFIFNSRAAENDAAPQRAFGKGQLLELAKKKLALTDEQTAQVKGAVKADRENIASLLTRMRDAQAELRAAIQAGDASEATVRAAAAKVAAVQADAAVERMKLFHQIAPMLTDDQRAKLAELQSRRQDQ